MGNGISVLIMTENLMWNFHAYYRQLCLHALHFMDSAEEAEDIVQETFVNLWDK